MPPAPAWKEKPSRMMPASRRELGDHLGDQQPVGALRDLGGAGDDLRRVADGWNLHDIVDVVALDLPGNAGEGHQVVGDDDDVVGVEGIGQREAERAAGRRAV